MKKFIIAMLFVFVGSFAFAQETQDPQNPQDTQETQGGEVAEENTTVIEGANSTDEKVIAQVIRKNRSKEFNHWMLSVGGGFNLMLCEREGTIGDPLKNYRKHFQGAAYINFGYMINPIWGVIAEYGFIPINKDIFTPEGNELGYGHEATIQLDFNILNLVRKCRKNTKWNIDALVGAGFFAYNSRYNIDQQTGEKKRYYYPAICVPVSLKFQYCPIDELGIALRITGKWTSEDDINYVYTGETNHNNDMMFYGGLELQYNITTKGKRHVRVTDRCTYEPMNVVLEGKIADVNKNTEKIDEIEKELDGVKEDVDLLTGNVNPDSIRTRTAGPVCCDKITAMQQQIDSLNDLIGRLGNVAVNAPRYDTTVINTGNVNITNNNILYQYNSGDNGIFFEFDSDKIQSEYYKDVMIIARRMLNDHRLKLKIIGYCDEQGSIEYNKKLAQRRINALIYLLVNRYRISKDRFTSENVGRITGENEISELNRRVDVEYYY